MNLTSWGRIIKNTCFIIINYKSTAKTVQCINSLLSEPINTVYVLDNSEKEYSDGKLSIYINQLNQKTEIDFRFVSFNENLGFARGVNEILHKDYQTGSHQYYCLLNNDTIIKKGLVNELIHTLNKGTSYALVMPRIKWGNELVGLNHYQRFFGFITQHPLLSFPYATGCCMMFKQCWLDHQSTLFDQRFFMYGEDVELCWRIHQSGKKIGYTEKALVIHEGTGSSSQGELFYEYYVARSHVLLATKLYKTKAEVPLILLCKSVTLLLRSIIRGWRYKSLIPLRAYFMCWFDCKINV